VAVGVLVAAVAVGMLSAAQRHPLVTDSLGYVTAGRGLADGDGLSWRDEVNRIAGPFSSPMAYPVRRGDPDELRFGYPAGLPVVIAAAVWTTGRDGAATLVGPVFAALAVGATAWLAWAALRSRAAAFAAAVGMALVPDLWRFGTDTWADVPATALAAAGVAAVLEAVRLRSGRVAVATAGAAAALLAALVWVRPAGLAVVVLVVGATAWSVRRDPDRPAGPVVAAFGGVLGVGVVGLLAWQWSWFGDPMSTGYSVEHGWYPHDAFSLKYAFGDSFVDGRSAFEAAATLWHDAGPLLAVAGVGLAVVAARQRLVLGAAVAGSVLPYTVYAFAATDENARFVLPALPFVVVAAVAAGTWVRTPRLVGVAVAVLAVAVLGPRSVGAWSDARDAADDAAARVGAAVAIAERTPPDAVLLSYEWNDALAVHGDRSVLNLRRIPPGDVDQGRYRTDLLPTCLTGAVDALLDAGRPVVVVEGVTPPALDPLPILRASFELRPDDGSPVLWSVGRRLPGADRGSVEPCRRAAIAR
jgi:hypothetical protein